MLVFVCENYLHSLFPDGRVCVREAMNNVRENLGIYCRLIQILNELLHLRNRHTTSG